MKRTPAAKFPGWMTQLALSLPRLELLRTEVQGLGADTWRVRMAVCNSGWLPAYVTRRALERKTVRGVMFEIHLPDAPAGPVAAPTLASGKTRIEGPHLEGHAPKASLQDFLPNRQITADRAVAEWVVRGPRGTRIALTARAARAGAVRTDVTLD